MLRQLQIREDGGEVNSFNSFDRLELHYHFVVDDQVHSIAALHVDTAVEQWKPLLPLHLKAPVAELVTQAGFVAGLEQPGSELAMHSNRCTNDRSGDIAAVHSVPSVPSVVSIPFEDFTGTNPKTMPDHAFFIPLRDL